MRQKNTNDTDVKTVLIAILAGAAAGLTVGLLMAPKSGEKLREDIGTSVDEYLDSARRKAGELKTSASNLAQRGLREVQKTKDAVASRVSSAVDRGASQSHDAIDSGAEKGHQAVNRAADAIRTGTGD